MAPRLTLRRWGTALLAGMLALSLAGGVFVRAHAAPTAYYVALTGRDTNPGTQAAPFRSFAKAASILMPGDSLYIDAGVYNQALKITRSGAAGLPITVQPVPGAAVVIDLLNQSANNISITGSYVVVRGLEVRNSTGFCVHLDGTHNTVQGLRVHECRDMGISTDGQDISILSNTVYHASAANSNFSMIGGWYSGIKVRIGGSRVLIANNRTYNNYGEGIAVTRASDVSLRGNISYDNASANIYIDNSYNVFVTRNFAYNHAGGFGPDGVPSDNIGLGEEPYGGWGARLSNISITNNVTFNGKHGVIYYGNDSGVAGGGLKNSTIAFNTLWGSVNSELSVIYDTGQTGNVIANNIIQQPRGNVVLIPNASGITFANNFWVGKLPPLYARGAGDKSGDVKLASTPGYAAATFRLGSASPAINAASLLDGIATDYSNSARPSGAAPDMGAFEFVLP